MNEENMKIKKSSFIQSAVSASQYPDETLPEIAFSGRSNVGKSSIINMLLGRKGLAKTSSTPGKTRLVNFFDIDGLFRFCDLPGYGYAKVSKQEQEGWGKIIETYLFHRPNLLEIVLLLDIRRVPNSDDIKMYQFIQKSGFEGIIICTKCDKMSKNQIAQSAKKIRKTLSLSSNHPMFYTSSTTRNGKYEVWDYINQLFEHHGFDIHLARQQEIKK